jgi:SAM-dependent methyltransferase
LPATGLVLEVASGTGEHAVFLARRFPQLQWQPSDADPAALASISAWREAVGSENLLPPLVLDASAPEWPLAQADAVVCINMVHISPWAATEGLLSGAGRLLATGAPLILYGPFRERDVPTAPSNEAFDQSLTARDPAWGLRLAEDVDAAAQRYALARAARHAMPANNLMLVYRRT